MWHKNTQQVFYSGISTRYIENECELIIKLGYKVFDVQQVPAYHEQLNAYGKKEIDFAECAKIWEENEFDVIIEPAGLFWYEMAKHWPKTKLINITRDVEGWSKSLKEFCSGLDASNCLIRSLYLQYNDFMSILIRKYCMTCQMMH